MSDSERIAILEAEISRLHRVLADQAAALAEHARRESAERERRESRRIINRQNYERRKARELESDSDCIKTLNPPSPLLDGSPLSPEPSLPSPLSSPQPHFSSPMAATSEGKTADDRPALVLTFAQPDKPEAKPAGKPRRERKPAADKPENKGDPRHASTVAAIVETYREVKGAAYGFQGGKDAKAITDLLALADQEANTKGEKASAEILRRWRIALRWRGFPACTGLLSFRDNWNAYVGEQGATPTGGNSQPKPTKFIEM